MLDKKTAKQNLLQTRLDLAEQIIALRRNNHLRIVDLAAKSAVPSLYIEKLELGVAEINIGYLNQIARTFHQKISIALKNS